MEEKKKKWGTSGEGGRLQGVKYATDPDLLVSVRLAEGGEKLG